MKTADASYNCNNVVRKLSNSIEYHVIRTLIESESTSKGFAIEFIINNLVIKHIQ